MLQLILLRHAKSDWDNPALGDHERTLNEQGAQDAPRVAAALKERLPQIDLLLSSSASRARETAAAFAEAFDLHRDRALVMSELYLAAPQEVEHCIRRQRDAQALLVVAHNPGIEQMLALLAPDLAGEVSTCTLACLDLPIDEWKDFALQEAVNGWRLGPKDLP